jgi:hypothetical protein
MKLFKRFKMENRVFKFREDELKHFLNHQLNFLDGVKKAFDYVREILEKNKHFHDFTKSKKFDLTKLNWYETKNCEWTALKYNNINMIIRKYRTHFMIYMNKVESTFWDRSKVSAITYYVDTDGFRR